MSGQKKPVPDIAFRMMSFALSLHHRFADIGKQLTEAGIEEGQIVLDFGCGPGHYAIAAARMVGEKGRVYALDMHPLAARSVEKKANKEGLSNISTILSDGDTGLPDQSIDVVLVYDMIHSVADKKSLLYELHRVIKPHGVLSILVRHMKVEGILELVQKNGLFSLRDRHGSLLNFERMQS